MLRFPIATLRWPARLIKWLFLLTLPVTIFPVFSGTITGITFGIWNQRHVDDTTNKFLDQVKDFLGDWGVGGDAPTFRNFMDTYNDFHLVRVNGNDWLSKLGFVLPNEYTDPDDDTISIDKYADLGTLMRDTSCRSNARKPREQWLYLSYLAFPGLDAWDTAFNGVLEYVHAHPSLNQSGFHFATCGDTAGFLCGVWWTRSPALLHFKVEDDPPNLEDLDEGLTYSAHWKYLRPVTVRLIEFPFENKFTGLPMSTFPSPKQQMLSMLAGERLYEQFEPYDTWVQMLRRFAEIWNNASQGTVLNYFNKADEWMIDHVANPLGIEPALAEIGGFLMSFFGLASVLTCGMIRGVANQIREFFGQPKLGDLSLAGIDMDQSPEDLFWGDVIGGMGNFIADEKRREAEQKSSSGATDTSMSITMA
jgi:hypothetical protein